MYRPLVQQYGADRVWQVGERVLGFPPDWMLPPPLFAEVRQVARALQSEGEGDSESEGEGKSE
jgi:hypothetical protein